jgi:hypothetical protein
MSNPFFKIYPQRPSQIAVNYCDSGLLQGLDKCDLDMLNSGTNIVEGLMH